MTQLMDRIYCNDFIHMQPKEQVSMIERIQAIRTSALMSAQMKSKRVTKSAMKNIAKRAGTKKGKRMLKDPTKAAITAMKKLSSDQIIALANYFPKE